MRKSFNANAHSWSRKILESQNICYVIYIQILRMNTSGLDMSCVSVWNCRVAYWVLSINYLLRIGIAYVSVLKAFGFWHENLRAEVNSVNELG